MSKPQELKFNIKVVINKEKKKVLFAEASAHFTDVLLTFLVLPLTKIIEVLKKHYPYKAPVIGSLNTLYKAAANLSIDHFHGESLKKHLISSPYFDDELSGLGLTYGAQTSSFSSGRSYRAVFTDGASSFIITDDLRVLPIVGCSIIETLSSLGIAIEDMDAMETRIVTFGLNEIIALLKESLISSNPLTAFIFPGKQVIVETKRAVLLHPKDAFMTSKNMMLKVLLQKSTNKFLFAQANGNFIDFLFFMLTISLARVNCYLGKNIASLQYKGKSLLSKCKHDGTRSFVCPLGMYIVRDDLSVSPLGITSGISAVKEFKISLSDIKEVKLQVGLDEGLSILKASLTSTTALTNGLIKPFLSKQEMDIKPCLKQEME